MSCPATAFAFGERKKAVVWPMYVQQWPGQSWHRGGTEPGPVLTDTMAVGGPVKHAGKKMLLLMMCAGKHTWAKPQLSSSPQKQRQRREGGSSGAITKDQPFPFSLFFFFFACKSANHEYSSESLQPRNRGVIKHRDEHCTATAGLACARRALGAHIPTTAQRGSNCAC